MSTLSQLCCRAARRAVHTIALVLAASAHADLSLSPVLSDHAVLQRDMPVPIWGRATPGKPVEVRFAGQTVTTTSDANGAWSVDLAPLTKSAAPRDLVIVAGDDRITLHDVLVGEVWLCGGQSNMEWELARTKDFEAAKLDASSGSRSTIRALKMPHTQADRALARNDARWRVTDGDTVASITGVGYHFATVIADTLDVPVGILDINWGGTRIEPWMHGGQMFQGMIQPVTPFAVRGALWYQGESNAGEAEKYADQLTQMIAAWRTAFRRPEMPFGIVQLASYMETSDDPAQGGWSALRAAQAKVAATVPHCGLAVTLDVGDAKDIHPRDKKTVATRLAAWALVDAYGQTSDNKGSSSGPVFASVERGVSKDGTKGLRVRFTHGEGLRAQKGDRIGGFAIAGADGKFVWVDAQVDARSVDAGDHADHASVMLFSPEVPEPIEVVYAWQNNPYRANLVNGAGLPAGPFRAKLSE